MFIGHAGFEWIIAGLVVFAGLMIFFIKVARGHVLGVIASAIVWVFVYKIHSGSTQGIMTATLAALLFDLVGIPMLKLFSRR